MTTLKNIFLTRKIEKHFEKMVKKNLGEKVKIYMNDFQINKRDDEITRITIGVSVDADKETLMKLKDYLK